MPLTTTQDWSLFNVLQQNSIELWKQQIDMVLEKHGLVSFNIHPDYATSATGEKGRPVHEDFEYSSGTNPHFLSVDGIRELLARPGVLA